MKNLDWIKFRQNNWGDFYTLNLNTIDEKIGVYIIWNVGIFPRAVRVGQGDIKERIADHRRDPEITSIGPNMRVTWAALEKQYLDGVERYLEIQLDPMLGVRFPDVQPIPVNLP